MVHSLAAQGHTLSKVIDKLHATRALAPYAWDALDNGLTRIPEPAAELATPQPFFTSDVNQVAYLDEAWMAALMSAMTDHKVSLTQLDHLSGHGSEVAIQFIPHNTGAISVPAPGNLQHAVCASIPDDGAQIGTTS